jgi:pimeloyl-ACP methyl ester carboxylesterase
MRRTDTSKRRAGTLHDGWCLRPDARQRSVCVLRPALVLVADPRWLLYSTQRRRRPMTERMLTRPGAPALRYWDDGGERPPVLLIHGVGADGSSWDQIAAAPRVPNSAAGPARARPLRTHRRRADSRRLCARRGCRAGHLRGARSPYRGFSLGGMILGIALQHANRVRQLVLLSLALWRPIRRKSATGCRRDWRS